jgi:hypothetical protein
LAERDGSAGFLVLRSGLERVSRTTCAGGRTISMFCRHGQSMRNACQIARRTTDRGESVTDVSLACLVGFQNVPGQSLSKPVNFGTRLVGIKKVVYLIKWCSKFLPKIW